MNSLIPNETKLLIETEVKNILKDGTKLVKITSDQEIVNANKLCGDCKSLIKEYEEKRKSLVNPYNDKVKEINNWFKPIVEKLEGLQKNIKQVIVDYQKERAIEAERIRQEQFKKIEEERKKKLEEEQKILEEKRKLELDIQNAKQNSNIDLEKTEQNLAFLKMEEGLLKAEPVKVLEPITVSIPKTNVYTQKKYTVEIINKKELVEFCLKTDQLNLIEFDISTMNKIANATKGTINFVGCKIIESEIQKFR